MSAFRIKPYRKGPNWFFDDPDKGLVKEGLTDGVPEILESMYRRKKMTTGNAVVWFSSEPAEEPEHVLFFVRPEGHGTLYRCDDGRECWFCPALFRYFDTPPAILYVWLEAVPTI